MCLHSKKSNMIEFNNIKLKLKQFNNQVLILAIVLVSLLGLTILSSIYDNDSPDSSNNTPDLPIDTGLTRGFEYPNWSKEVPDNYDIIHTGGYVTNDYSIHFDSIGRNYYVNIYGEDTYFTIDEIKAFLEAEIFPQFEGLTQNDVISAYPIVYYDLRGIEMDKIE